MANGNMLTAFKPAIRVAGHIHVPIFVRNLV